MPQSSLWLQSLVLAIVGVLASWAGNNLPTLGTLQLPLPWWVILAIAVGTSLVLNLLPSLWGESTATDQQTISRG